MYLLFDIGGTNTRLAVSRDGESFADPRIIPTEQVFEHGIAAMVKVAGELAQGEKIEKAAGGIAGPLDREHTMLLNSPNISGWIKKPLKKELERALEASVVLENDSALVGMGEMVYGAGKDFPIAVYLNVGTGVGGARFVNGRVDVNALGFEPGHQIIDSRGEACPGCNQKGHLEGYVGGAAVEKRFRKKAYEIDEPEVWDELAKWLAIGLNNATVHWSPDGIVLGGSMIVGDPAIPIDRIESHFAEIMNIFPRPPAIKKAELKDIGGLYGALSLVNQSYYV